MIIDNIDLQKALLHNPFDGDFGSTKDRTFKDKIVKFRKERHCSCCKGNVVPGSFGRSMTMFWDGDGVMSYSFCTECTKAIAVSSEDYGKSWESRINLENMTIIELP